MKLIARPLRGASSAGCGTGQRQQPIDSDAPWTGRAGIGCEKLPHHGVDGRSLHDCPDSGSLQDIVVDGYGQVHDAILEYTGSD